MWGHVAPGVVRQIFIQSRSHELLIHKRGLPLVCITSVVKRFELTCGCALLHAVRALMCLRTPQHTRCVSPDACPKTKTKMLVHSCLGTPCAQSLSATHNWHTNTQRGKSEGAAYYKTPRGLRAVPSATRSTLWWVDRMMRQQPES